MQGDADFSKNTEKKKKNRLLNTDTPRVIVRTFIIKYKSVLNKNNDIQMVHTSR